MGGGLVASRKETADATSAAADKTVKYIPLQRLCEIHNLEYWLLKWKEEKVEGLTPEEVEIGVCLGCGMSNSLVRHPADGLFGVRGAARTDTS